MDRVKEIIHVLTHKNLLLQGKGRTYVNIPLWLIALIALSSLRLTIITIILIIAFGLKPELTNG